VFIEEPFVILYVVIYFWVPTQKKKRNTKQCCFKRHSSSSSLGRATGEDKLFAFFFCFFPPHSPPPTCPNTIKTQHLQLSRASTQMSQYIERAKKALNNKQRHLMIMEHQRGGPYISNHVRMHACHRTSKHCTYIFDLLQENPQ